MQRRIFIQNTITASTFLGLSTESVFSQDFSFDGSFLYQDNDGSIHIIYHQYAKNQFFRSQIIENGQILSKEHKAIFDEKHFVLFPYNTPKNNFGTMLSFEFDNENQKLKTIHVIKPLPEQQSFEYIYGLNCDEVQLHGKEKILLLLDNKNENDVATFLYQDDQNKKHFIGVVQKNGTQYFFQKNIELGDFSLQLQNAKWSGPFNHLIGHETNVFIAENEDDGIYFFQYRVNEIRLLTKIENHQSFGNFVYERPKVTEENIGQNKTQLFSVIDPYAPEGLLSSQKVLTLFDKFGIYFLNYDVALQNFRVIFQDKNRTQNKLRFLNCQLNYTKNHQPDLFVFRDDEFYYYAALMYQNGSFNFQYKKLSQDLVDKDSFYASHYCKFNTNKMDINSSAQNSNEISFEYPLMFFQKGNLSYFQLNIGSLNDSFKKIETEQISRFSEKEKLMGASLEDQDSGVIIALVALLAGITASICFGGYQYYKVSDVENKYEKLKKRKVSVSLSTPLMGDAEAQEHAVLTEEKALEWQFQIQALIAEKEELKASVAGTSRLKDEISYLEDQITGLNDALQNARVENSILAGTGYDADMALKLSAEKNVALEKNIQDLTKEFDQRNMKIKELCNLIKNLGTEISKLKGRQPAPQEERILRNQIEALKLKLKNSSEANKQLRLKILTLEKQIKEFTAPKEFNILKQAPHWK